MASHALSDDQICSRIERLAGLFEKGILSKEEYEAKKDELLARL
ncbi:SHOCT domain-containing protein [Sulfitobacter sp. D35]|nr:SHOCT domain-containing protein [Sulfitobacter sp. D35]MDW4500222.1 SHOCT domain-containing protein [Sulfitobacter sp. D35]